MIKRIHMTFDQQLEADKLFSEHMWRTEDGTYRYKDGWSDEVVATTIGAKTVTQVQKFRVKRGYRLLLPEDHPKLIARKRSKLSVDDLEARLEEYRTELKNLIEVTQVMMQDRMKDIEEREASVVNHVGENTTARKLLASKWDELFDRLSLRVNTLSAQLTDIAKTQSDLAKRLTDLEDVKTAPNASPHIGEGWKS